MKNRFGVLLLGSLLFLFSSSVLADDLEVEGRIESIDTSSQSFVVHGIPFFVTPSTDYDDGLRGFADFREGQKVEVEFRYREGNHYVTEVELED